MKRDRKLRGFTLVELMITISIIVILAGMLFAVVGAVTARQKVARTKMLLSKVEGALKMYKADNGNYPNATGTDSTNNLWSVLGPSGGGYLKTSDLNQTRNLSGNDICDDYKDTAFAGGTHGSPFIYIRGTAEAASGAIPTGLTTTYFGFKTEFELWSRGPDGLFAATSPRTTTTSTYQNYDNITNGKYAAGM